MPAELHVAVLGGGVAGLGCALALSRTGHRVTVVERDATPLPDSADDAFHWDRRGAPQVRHSHAFLARLRNLLRDRYPDVLAALLDAGASDLDFIEMLPETMDRTRRPGDDDLVALACRRTTFEWVLRRCVLDSGSVTFRHGVSVTSLVHSVAADGALVAEGVGLDTGEEIRADLVVAAGGRRDPSPSLLAAVGVEVVESAEDTGIIYFSRFFRLRDGEGYPVKVGPIGGDLGYVKYGVFPGDNRTFSITLAARSDDAQLRAVLLDGDRFIAVASNLPATAAYVDGRAEPITGVEVMAKLLNRRRRFTDSDGRPVLGRFTAVGDAHTCTNPIYGRGCSLAIVQAELLADALGGHAEVGAAIVAYEEACDREVLPWYRAAVAQDAANRALASPGTTAASGGDGGAGVTVPSTASGGGPGLDAESMRALLRDGLLPAMRVDPIVLRAFLRMFNLLEAPDSLLTDWDVIGRVMAVYQDRDNRPPEPELGPDRDEMFAAIS